MKFGTIVVDPPWPYAAAKNKNGSGYVSQHDRSQYSTMTIQRLAELPIADLADETSVLLLWTTPAFSAGGDATALCRAWGFRPVTYTYWIKMTVTGKPTYGVGYWFRGSVEPVLVGSRGRAFRTNERGAFFASPRGHSVKPDCFYEMTEKHFPEPRLDLFARKHRDGWICVGDEVTGSDVLSDLQKLLAEPA